MKRYHRTYTFDGNLWHLIHGVLINDARCHWNRTIDLIAEMIKELFGVFKLVISLFVLIAYTLTRPFVSVFTIFKALFVLRLRKIASYEAMPEDMYLWRVSDGIFKYTNAQRRLLDSGLFFLPNAKDRAVIDKIISNEQRGVEG